MFVSWRRFLDFHYLYKLINTPQIEVVRTNGRFTVFWVPYYGCCFGMLLFTAIPPWYETSFLAMKTPLHHPLLCFGDLSVRKGDTTSGRNPGPTQQLESDESTWLLSTPRPTPTHNNITTEPAVYSMHHEWWQWRLSQLPAWRTARTVTIDT